MSTPYYLDKSALVKLYHQEAGTDQVEALFTQSDNSMIISELAVVELYSTVARKVRTGEISEEAYEEVLKNFDDDCKWRFVFYPFEESLVSFLAKCVRVSFVTWLSGNWRRRADSNRCIEVLQTSPLTAWVRRLRNSS